MTSVFSFGPVFLTVLMNSCRPLEGFIFSKKAFIVTIRLEQRRKIDLDIWVLGKHILDGAVTIKPGSGQGSSIPAGTSIPVPGDLVFADVWVQAALPVVLLWILTFSNWQRIHQARTLLIPTRALVTALLWLCSARARRKCVRGAMAIERWCCAIKSIW